MTACGRCGCPAGFPTPDHSDTTRMNDPLEVTLRSTTGSREARRLRRSGHVPAILYGHGEECVGLSAKREDVEAAIRHGSRIVELKGAVATGALIRELQWDTFGVEPLHIDFVRVSATERVTVKVPVELKGDCPGQRAGGIINILVHEIELACKADHVPERVFAPVSQLEVGHVLKVADLELPEGTSAVPDSEETVVSCTMPGRKAAAETEEASAEPEVIARGGEEAAGAAEAGDE